MSSNNFASPSVINGPDPNPQTFLSPPVLPLSRSLFRLCLFLPVPSDFLNHHKSLGFSLISNNNNNSIIHILNASWDIGMDGCLSLLADNFKPALSTYTTTLSDHTILQSIKLSPAVFLWAPIDDFLDGTMRRCIPAA
ncbi:hypothetical protein CVT24_003658, partial [Panaeolus cyanescens]